MAEVPPTRLVSAAHRVPERLLLAPGRADTSWGRPGEHLATAGWHGLRAPRRRPPVVKAGTLGLAGADHSARAGVVAARMLVETWPFLICRDRAPNARHGAGRSSNADQGLPVGAARTEQKGAEPDDSTRLS
jgi:hypothetical protein